MEVAVAPRKSSLRASSGAYLETASSDDGTGQLEASGLSTQSAAMASARPDAFSEQKIFPGLVHERANRGNASSQLHEGNVHPSSHGYSNSCLDSP